MKFTYITFSENELLTKDLDNKDIFTTDKVIAERLRLYREGMSFKEILEMETNKSAKDINNE